MECSWLETKNGLRVLSGGLFISIVFLLWVFTLSQSEVHEYRRFYGDLPHLRIEHLPRDWRTDGFCNRQELMRWVKRYNEAKVSLGPEMRYVLKYCRVPHWFDINPSPDLQAILHRIVNDLVEKRLQTTRTPHRHDEL